MKIIKKFRDWMHLTLFNFRVLFLPKRYGAKVFCIGYNKTGTTALGEAIKSLGYNHSTFNRRVWRKHYLKGDLESVIRYTACFDSFDDLPWLKEDMIPLLDKTFKESRFIYLEREEAAWKKSFSQWTFSVTGKLPNVEDGWDRYLKHKEFVLSYFKDRQEDLLRLRITDPDGFKKLAQFLGKETKHSEFTVYNKSRPIAD